MKATIAPAAVAAALAVSALAVPAAEAHIRPPAAPRATAADRLHVRLREARSALAQATAELASLQKKLASPQLEIRPLRAQASRLGKTLAVTSSRLNAARADLDAGPSPLAEAVEQVRREVAWAQGGIGVPSGQLVAQAAMDYTVGHVSTGAYGYLELVGGVLPSFAPNDILGAQAGICGQAAQVFASIVQRLGLSARSVVFWYTDPNGPPDNHVAVEVAYGDGWHFFDPTFGQFWTDATGNVLSIADVRAGLGTEQKDLASFTNLVEDASLGDDTWFESDPATQVQVATWTMNG